MFHARLAVCASAIAFAAPVAAAPVTFGPVTVDSSTEAASVVVNGPGRSGTFMSNASAPFTGVTSLGEAAGGTPGSALFIGERFGAESPPADQTPTYEYLFGSAEVTLKAPVYNNPGNNIAVFVSGQLDDPTNPNSNGFKETVAVRALGSTGGFWYSDAVAFTTTLISGTSVFGYFTYLYDLTDLGIALGGSITGIEIANFSPWATVTGGSGDGFSGLVDPTGLNGVAIAGGLGARFAAPGTGGSCTDASPGIPTGATGNSYCLSGVFNGVTFERFDTDPDLLYVAGLVGSTAPAPIPLPAALPLLLAALGGLGLAARRRRPA